MQQARLKLMRGNPSAVQPVSDETMLGNGEIECAQRTGCCGTPPRTRTGSSATPQRR